ncbi:hypothetical protein FN846DRAFT_905483 [Sphaerosporella brunnea]|uniref:Nuclear fusion protein KAR5 n=1 Tax=Sphaerosporella brunnea TaxID=1250544 RepID=A0A5J5F109_9PEZI|nr:hypothetical protein FN846DRAFT_905483 [Sphaerosporella brunnea]
MARLAKAIISIIAIFSIPTGGDGYRLLQFREPAPPSAPTLILPAAVGEDTLSNRFPSSIQNDPRYAQVKLYLQSLQTKPTCHRVATALVSDCGKLDAATGAGGDVRYQYAAQLAVCELDALGIEYPDACRALNTRNSGYLGCVKQLEGRTQWWVTLSNSIQNARAICDAARHDVEKGGCDGENATKAQEHLSQAMDTALNEVWQTQREQKAFASSWKVFLGRIIGDVEVLQDGVLDKLRRGGSKLEEVLSKLLDGMMSAQVQSAAELEKINRSFRQTNEDSILWAEKIRQSREETDTVLAESAKSNHRDFERAMESIDEINAALSGTTFKSVRTLQEAIDDVSTALSHAAIDAQDLSSLRAVFDSLIQTHEKLERSQDAVDVRQRELQETLASLEPRINEMVTALHLSVEKVGKSLDDADNRIQALGGIWNRNSMALALIGFSMALWLGRENWRNTVGVMGVIVGLYMLYSANPQLNPLPSLKRELADSNAYQPTSLLGLRNVYISLAVLTVCGALLGTAFCWWRSRVEKKEQKLPA